MTIIKRFIIGPTATAIVLIAHYIVLYNEIIPKSAAGLYLMVLISGYFGLRSAFISAGLLAAYNLTFLGELTPERLTVAGSYFVMAWLIGSQSRRLRQETVQRIQNEAAASTLDGNIIKVRECRAMLQSILKAHRLDAEAYNDIEAVLHSLNNLAQATEGWRELGRLKGRLDR